jgi:ring-1,2-phenylacetyl-CoA epoxidase subunit PaaC
MISEYAIRLGDDSLVLGHRLSEWCRFAPFLEEDLALANTALDYIGRARMFYTYAAETEGKGRTEDDIAYLRDCREYRNLLMHELPRRDFAFSMARQFFIDVYNQLFLAGLAQSSDETLAAIGAKSLKETDYHVRRSTDWMLRLGDGTEESHQRLQSAVEALWGYTHELFEMDGLEQELAGQGVAVDVAALKPAWQETVNTVMAEATIEVPEDSWSASGGRDGIHTEYLGYLLTELQYVQRAYPGLKW